LRRQTELMARALKVKGLMNVQFAIQGEGDDAVVYVLEVNPRASRTVPFVSKATRQAAREDPPRAAWWASGCVAEGRRRRAAARSDSAVLQRQGSGVPVQQVPRRATPSSGRDALHRRGDGRGSHLRRGHAQEPARRGLAPADQGQRLHHGEEQRQGACRGVARDLHEMGFGIVATKGTGRGHRRGGVPVKAVNKVKDGRPHIVDMVKDGEIQLVFTTVDETRTAIADSRHIRQAGAGQPRHLLHQHGRLRGGGGRHEAPGDYSWCRCRNCTRELH
jgi:carbamoyl-phosphate synthase large subunit